MIHHGYLMLTETTIFLGSEGSDSSESEGSEPSDYWPNISEADEIPTISRTVAEPLLSCPHVNRELAAYTSIIAERAHTQHVRRYTLPRYAPPGTPVPVVPPLPWNDYQEILALMRRSLSSPNDDYLWYSGGSHLGYYEPLPTFLEYVIDNNDDFLKSVYEDLAHTCTSLFILASNEDLIYVNARKALTVDPMDLPMTRTLHKEYISMRAKLDPEYLTGHNAAGTSALSELLQFEDPKTLDYALRGALDAGAVIVNDRPTRLSIRSKKYNPYESPLALAIVRMTEIGEYLRDPDKPGSLTAIIYMLLDAQGADATYVTDSADGAYTLLHLLALCAPSEHEDECVQLAKVLMSRGAKCDQRDARGWLAANYAQARGLSELATHHGYIN